MPTSMDIAEHREMAEVTDVHKNTTGEENIETVELLSTTSTTLSTLKSSKPPHGLLKKQLGIGLTTATAILLLNLSLFIWSLSRTRSIYGTASVFTGDCKKSRRILVAITLLINIFSTILLGVCNNAAQYVSSPTRGEIDAAHRKGRWLHIGTHSFNNLRGIAKKRTIIWALLVSSSLPLHLFWNAIVHEKLSSNSYFGAIVTADFLNPESSYYYNQTNTAFSSPVVPTPDSIAAYHQNSSSLQFLDKNACLDAYMPAYQSNWRNFLLVVNTTYAQPLVTVTGFVPDAGHSIPVWPCDAHLLGRIAVPATEICDTDFLRRNTSWYINMLLCESYSSNGIACTKSRGLDLEVEYCLAEPSDGHCSIELVPEVLLIVVICNALKVACLAVILLLPRFQPIAIIGDAISSFLTTPDPVTQDVGPISAREARHRKPAGLTIGATPGRGMPWKIPNRNKRWCQAASPWRWVLLTMV